MFFTNAQSNKMKNDLLCVKVYIDVKGENKYSYNQANKKFKAFG